MKMPIEITFVDRFGEEERGIDGGGVFKEFLTELGREAFDVNRGLWMVNGQNEIYPATGAWARERTSFSSFLWFWVRV